MKRSHWHDFHLRDAPVAVFLTAFLLLILAASAVSVMTPWR